MSGDLSIGEAVKLRRRSSTANSILVKEIAAADEKVLRLRRKLEKKKRKKARLAHPGDPGDSGKVSIEEVSLSSSAITAWQSDHFVHREFSLPPSFPSLKSRQTEETDGSTLGASQLLDLINEDYSSASRDVEEPDSRLLYGENKSSGEKILGKIREFQLSLWAKVDGENFQNIFEAKLDRRLVDPVLVCSGNTFTISELFVEEDQVKLFRFSVLDPRGKPAVVTSSGASVLITETADIRDLHCLKVDDESTVIAYNISGRSRVHLFTAVEDRLEVQFLGNLETEVRNICLLHGSDKMFICLGDSQLIIWNLRDGKYLSKPIFIRPTRILGALLIKTKICFVVQDWKEVKLSVIENHQFKDLLFFQVGNDTEDSLQDLSLLSAKQDFLTFLAGERVLRLNMNTSEIVWETFF